ncbi:MAG: hypothetical protein QOG64_1950, partial [Acidimicrobiaceae bacterium]|nr:hypothetical protein [Acidimicrobiaceae bacterium]
MTDHFTDLRRSDLYIAALEPTSNKKVFVIGATGVIGRPAVQGLVEAGHQVTGMARSAEKAALLAGLGATPAEVDLFDVDSVTRAIDGHEVIVHMATHIPPMAKLALPGSFAETDRLRREATPILVDAARRVAAEAVIKESITFNYVDLGDQWIDEDTPVESGPYTNAALEAEDAALGFTGDGRRGIALRFGSFYGPDAQSTRDTVRMARRRLAAAIGPADAYLSSIHTDDAAAAVVAAVHAP